MILTEENIDNTQFKVRVDMGFFPETIVSTKVDNMADFVYKEPFWGWIEWKYTGNANMYFGCIVGTCDVPDRPFFKRFLDTLQDEFGILPPDEKKMLTKGEPPKYVIVRKILVSMNKGPFVFLCAVTDCVRKNITDAVLVTSEYFAKHQTGIKHMFYPSLLFLGAISKFGLDIVKDNKIDKSYIDQIKPLIY